MRTRHAWLGLILLLVVAVWYRAHTFGPTVREALGINLWPACSGTTEPLDCDEAIYAYIGHRMLAGDVMYRDLTENKPPLGYWLYELAVAVGGYNETAIRLMPLIPFLATVVLVWWIARAIRGDAAGLLAGALFVLLGTDPYLFGNGANMEHFMNLFGVAALASFLWGWERPNPRAMLLAGLFLGAEILVKQVAVTHGILFIVALRFRHRTPGQNGGFAWKSLARDWLVLGAGIAALCGLAAIVLIFQGAGPAAYEDIFRYGPALATDTLPEPNAPSPWIRWLTGNADPTGRLPWPFGATDYLVWWATGSWPLWLVALPSTAWLLLRRSSDAPRRIVAAWTSSTFLQVILPGLYWPHYYLLPVPGVALVVSILGGDLFRLGDNPAVSKTTGRKIVARIAALGLVIAMLATLHLQVRDYLRVPPEELTIRYKGGRQWVVLRRMAADIAARLRDQKDPRLFIWGWQSPLYFYGKLDSITPHVFTDNLLRDQADRNHPLIQPRTDAIVEAIQTRKPELIFSGYPPFRSLEATLRKQYLPSRTFPGLWVREDLYGQFEATR